MSDFPFLTALSLVTLVAVVGLGYWQLRSVRRSQAKHGETPGTLTHHNLSADGDFADPHTTDAAAASGPAGLHPEPVGAANTTAASRPDEQ